MIPLLRVVLRIALVIAALRGVAVILARRGNVGDAESDEFSIAAIFGGVERVSRARSLRNGRILACFGGVELDLREATLDPGGADLVLRACLGGVEVLVPEEWRVLVAAESRAGGVDVRVTPEPELAEDAPSLRVTAFAALGGVQVTTGRADENDVDSATESGAGPVDE